MGKKAEANEVKVLELLKPIFDAEPSIKALPVFAWGRYYKYECAGGKFDSNDREDFEDMQYFDVKGVKVKDLLLADKVVKKLYPEDTFEFYEPVLTHNRKPYSKVFDERFGMALVAVRKQDGSLEFDYWDCDSPE